MIPAPWEGSTPGVPQTNARVERTVQDVLDGCRVFLHMAGLPNCFWPYAVQCYCHLDNIRRDSTTGASPWHKRFGQHFQGKQFVFGQGVWFRPGKTNETLPHANTRLIFGVFLGYRLHPGCMWCGEYLVDGIKSFVKHKLRIHAKNTVFALS